MLRAFRLTHLYVGVFIAPAILFFAFTGALQTFSLHEKTQGSDYSPPKWAVVMGQIHKKQTAELPQRKGPPPAAKSQDKPAGEKPFAVAPATAPTPPATPAPPKKSHLPLKIFFLLVSIGLFTSTLTGIYMSYRYNSNKVAVTALLIAGAVIPIVLLRF
jgi:hypothetical protein